MQTSLRTIFLAALVVCSEPVLCADNAVIFDGYRRGIHSYSLVVAKQSGALRLERRDLLRNLWEPPIESHLPNAIADPKFALPGALKDFYAHFSAIQSTRFAGNAAVGLSGLGALYGRERRMSAEVEGKTIEANYWALRDGSSPMDLIIDDNDQLIAAIDVSQDQIMVRRGYENFTTVARWRKPGVSQPDYGIQTLEPQWVAADSGERLATLVYLPAGDAAGPFPTILVRTPYGISNLVERYQHHVMRGYALVLQAVKGTSYWDANPSEGD